MSTLNRKLTIAPMMNRTDRHFRYLMRIIAPHALLYTEMITTDALLHGNRQQLLQHHEAEYPLAIQLGGNNPEHLAQCAVIVEDMGYDEVNLNVGCPSPRVQSGQFGACLLAKPALVAECVLQMRHSVQIPITIKTRIGIDDQDSYEEIFEFVDCVSKAGCNVFIIHARKAWLQGLSPKENRHIPELQYEVVYQLKKDLPELDFIINGGLKKEASILQQLNYVNGVMIGRMAYQDPYFMAQIDRALFADKMQPLPDRYEILDIFMRYVEQQLQHGVPLGRMSRHILSMFANQPNARSYRRSISENAYRAGAGIAVLQTAIKKTRLEHA